MMNQTTKQQKHSPTSTNEYAWGAHKNRPSSSHLLPSSSSSSSSTSSPALMFEKTYIQPVLENRRRVGSIRKLVPFHNNDPPTTNNNTNTNTIDFSSNDYLGLAQSIQQHTKVETMYQSLVQNHKNTTTKNVLGSTGSRLLTGDSYYAQQLEIKLAKYHINRHQDAGAAGDGGTGTVAALLCNSGYDANLTVMSCMTKNCIVLVDELCHNSIRMGLQLSSNCTIYTFQHNNLQDLQQQLIRIVLQQQQQQQQQQAQSHQSQKRTTTTTDDTKTTKQQHQQQQQQQILIVVESVYSMDGDIAPLKQILDLAMNFNACVIVDEAHGLGVFGKSNNDNDNTGSYGGTGVVGELNVEHHPALLVSIYTFGKAAGCHGAVIICRSQFIKEYLLNYGKPIIYSTSLPLHSLVSISCAYETITNPIIGQQLRSHVKQLVQLFQYDMNQLLVSRLSVVRNNNNNNHHHRNHHPILPQSDNNNGVQTSPLSFIRLVSSSSPIQALVVPGNTQCIQFCNVVWEKSNYRIRLYPIRSPTVPKGEERVRIILHSHNTLQQVKELIHLLQRTMIELGYMKNFNYYNDEDDDLQDDDLPPNTSFLPSSPSPRSNSDRDNNNNNKSHYTTPPTTTNYNTTTTRIQRVRSRL